MKKITLTLLSFIFSITIIQANVVIINGLTHSYSGVSGQTFQGEVVLANTSNKEQRVTFGLSEALYNCEEGRMFVENANHKNSSTNWFEGAVAEKVLLAKEKYTFKFSITIPNDVSLNGSYWTTLMINVDKPIKEEVVNNIGLDTMIRYAVRLLTDVNIKEEVAIDFKSVNLKLNKQNNKRQLDVKVLNESIFIENVKLTLEVYDVNGTKVIETATNRSKIFPNVCRDFSIDVSNLPIGNYQCIILADSREEFIGTNVNLTIE